ncbi:hypothetical protein NKJ81_25480 [Mesorhizobium sp. M0018]|uniref:hypothetical protein n=1 Tax=Mesorhizobium sp. M0018 TaxID=2956844 RepID=UPI00333565F3
MNELLGLSIDLQIVLVAGYLGYRVSIIGRGIVDRTEDFVFKVLTYGLIGKLIAHRVIDSSLLVNKAQPEAILLQTGAATVVFSVMAASLWRRAFSGWFSWAMKKLTIYQDDHEASVWSSIVNCRSIWDYVQVHLASGKIIESHFSQVDEAIPMRGITLNEDGLAMYVTAIYRPDGSQDKFAPQNDGGFAALTYIPRDQITQMDISWKASG